MTGLLPHPLGVETLDGPDGDPAVVRATLADIAQSNRLFGGRSAVVRGVRRLCDDHAGPLSVLDVGAGAGDIVRYLATHLSRQNRRVVPIALERHPEAARVCREGGTSAVLADGSALPIATGGVDIVIASQLLHHVDRAGGVRLVREFSRVARIGVVVADIRRALPAEVGIWLASWLLAFHPVSRKDGVMSVRRGFSAPELHDLLAAAGVSARVERRPQFRLLATWRCDAGH